MNFPIFNKRKACILNTFEYGEQYKKKSGNNRNKYITVIKLLKTVSLSDFDVVNFSK